MTDKEILKLALKQAGLFCESDYYDVYDTWSLTDLTLSFGSYDDYCQISVRDLILKPEFAKAFWGNKKIEIDQSIFDGKGLYRSHFYVKSWQYHLQQMVILDNPIKYLESFLKNNNKGKINENR
ncbi:MAG: hypothetical protein M0R03_20860 [Novosphingobium sp.]|nr:hypothetical protein [Novosphingobium sp.]